MSYLDEGYLTGNIFGYRDQPIEYGKLKPTGQRTSPAEVEFLKIKLQNERDIRESATRKKNAELLNIQSTSKKTPTSYTKEGFANNPNGVDNTILTLNTTHLLIIIFIMIFILMIMNLMTMRCLREVLALIKSTT